MFKRVVWMGAGFSAGVGATLWADVKVRRAAQRLAPTALGADLSQRMRSLRDDVVDAVRDGRQAMVAREAELRAGRLPLRSMGPPDRPAIPVESRQRIVTDSGQSPAARFGPALILDGHGKERASTRLL